MVFCLSQGRWFAAFLIAGCCSSSCSWIVSITVHVTALSSNASSNIPKPHRRVIVVGAGVGGLSVAARIASSPSSQGCEVLLLEKNAMLGGRCGSFDVVHQKGTFRHERGPSLLLLQNVYQDLFRDCCGGDNDGGETISERFGLEIKPCVPAYQVVFEDGDRIELGFPKPAATVVAAPAEVQSRAKMDQYESDGSTKWDEYMRATAAFLDCGLPNFIEERLDLVSFPAFLKESLRGGGKAWPLKPHSDVLDAMFDSNKMRALASFQDLYVGLEPYRNPKEFAGGILRKTAPAVFGLLAAIELHPTNDKAGVFAPIGGFRAVEQAFQNLAEEKGVKICLGKTVTNVQSDGVHVCDTLDNSKREFLKADLIIVNQDLPVATKTLFGDKVDSKGEDSSQQQRTAPRFDWDDKFDFSSGVIAFHWSLEKSLDDLNTHNVFLVSNSRAEAEQSWSAVRSPEESSASEAAEPFNFYVHRASKTDPTAAPEGCDSIMVLVPCKTLTRDPDYAHLDRAEAMEKYKEQFDEKYISAAREAVFKRLSVVDSLGDLREHILDEVVDSLATYADLYNIGAGTPFALSHGFGQLSLTRPAAGSSKTPNVLFVGASSRPGNGVPLVLIGAKLVAEKATNILSKALSG